MCDTPRAGRYQTKNRYLELLEQTIRHTESLQKQLIKMKESYPVGENTTRDIIHLRSCLLCALESIIQ